MGDEHLFTTAAKLHPLARERQYGMCLACHGGLRTGEGALHHRVRRRDLGWCACNVVLLHAECHTNAPQAVHQRPEWARARGLIVPSWTDPRGVPVPHQWPYSGDLFLACDGSLGFDAPTPR